MFRGPRRESGGKTPLLTEPRFVNLGPRPTRTRAARRFRAHLGAVVLVCNACVHRTPSASGANPSLSEVSRSPSPPARSSTFDPLGPLNDWRVQDSARSRGLVVLRRDSARGLAAKAQLNVPGDAERD